MILLEDGSEVLVEDMWKRCGSIILRKKNKQDILAGKELTDTHINAFHDIMKEDNPELKGSKVL